MNDLERLAQEYFTKRKALAEMMQELDPYIDEVERLERELKDAVIDNGQTYQDSNVVVQFRNAYERTSWDSKRLEGLAMAYPAIAECKKTSMTRASAAIKIIAPPID